MMRKLLMGVLPLLVLAGCELLVDFDRTKIPTEGGDASTLPPPVPTPNDDDQNEDPTDASTEDPTDATTEEPTDAEAADGDTEEPTADASPEEPADDAGADAGDAGEEPPEDED